MTWAVFLDTDGKPKVELYAFCRGKRVVSEWVDKRDAHKALDEYNARAREEAERDMGQLGLFGGK